MKLHWLFWFVWMRVLISGTRQNFKPSWRILLHDTYGLSDEALESVFQDSRGGFTPDPVLLKRLHAFSDTGYLYILSQYLITTPNGFEKEGRLGRMCLFEEGLSGIRSYVEVPLTCDVEAAGGTEGLIPQFVVYKKDLERLFVGFSIEGTLGMTLCSASMTDLNRFFWDLIGMCKDDEGKSDGVETTTIMIGRCSNLATARVCSADAWPRLVDRWHMDSREPLVMHANLVTEKFSAQNLTDMDVSLASPQTGSNGVYGQPLDAVFTLSNGMVYQAIIFDGMHQRSKIVGEGSSGQFSSLTKDALVCEYATSCGSCQGLGLTCLWCNETCLPREGFLLTCQTEYKEEKCGKPKVLGIWQSNITHVVLHAQNLPGELNLKFCDKVCEVLKVDKTRIGNNHLLMLPSRSVAEDNDRPIPGATGEGDVAWRKISWMLRVAARRQVVRPACGYSKQPKHFAKRHYVYCALSEEIKEASCGLLLNGLEYPKIRVKGAGHQFFITGTPSWQFLSFSLITVMVIMVFVLLCLSLIWVSRKVWCNFRPKEASKVNLDLQGAAAEVKVYGLDHTKSCLWQNYLADMQDFLVAKDALSICYDSPIGEGHFGVVYKATLSNSDGPPGELVAVKTLIQNCQSVTLSRSFLKEALCMKDLNHERILGIKGISCFTNQNHMEQILIIMPFMEHGDLLSHLRNPHNRPTVKDLLNFAQQVAEGMQYLHQMKLVHRDLAARNCMLDEGLNIKIADFGLCRDVYETGTYVAVGSDSYGTRFRDVPVRWMALESIQKGIYDQATDVWSYGVLLWEVMTRGDIPYCEMGSVSQLVTFLSSGGRLKQPQYCPGPLYRVMQSCWNAVRCERPTFTRLTVAIPDIVSKMLVSDKQKSSEA